MELLYKANNIEIYYDSMNRYFHCNWIGYQNKVVLLHSGAVILDLLKQKSVVKILNNNTKVEGPWTDSSEWTATQWFPDMAQAGLHHFAWVLSPDAFAELSARRAMPTAGRINIQLFDSSNDSFNDAVTWLHSYPNGNPLQQ